MDEVQKIERTLLKEFSHKEKIDKLFVSHGSVRMNACVGYNGFVDNSTYVKGYERTLDLLMLYLVRNSGLNIDSSLYPLLYSTRHSVELLLKEIEYKYNEIININNGYSKTHSLSKIFDETRDKLWNFDCRFRNSLNKIKPLVNELSNVDDTGQTFRYAYDLEGQKHLSNMQIINVHRFYISSKKMIWHLKSMLNLLQVIKEERKMGVYTQRFSHRELVKIANVLPPMSKWKLNEFEEAKRYVMEKYNVGSRQFSLAICEIKKSYLANKIDDSIPAKKRVYKINRLIAELRRFESAFPPLIGGVFIPGAKFIEKIKHREKEIDKVAVDLTRSFDESTIKMCIALYEIAKTIYRPEYFNILIENLNEHIEYYDESRPIKCLLSIGSPADEIQNGMEKIKIA
jgi:hypothetical protein